MKAIKRLSNLFSLCLYLLYLFLFCLLTFYLFSSFSYFSSYLFTYCFFLFCLLYCYLFCSCSYFSSYLLTYCFYLFPHRLPQEGDCIFLDIYPVLLVICSPLHRAQNRLSLGHFYLVRFF